MPLITSTKIIIVLGKVACTNPVFIFKNGVGLLQTEPTRSSGMVVPIYKISLSHISV
jgi:hypothetical protein